jgi:rare lipoprotein A
MHVRSPRWQGIAPLLIAVALILSGCASAPQLFPPVADGSPKRQSAPAPAPVAKNAPVLPPAGSGRGGYYQDDGPGEKIPEGLLETPDAEPRVEPYSVRGNKPYAVFGKTYAPMIDEKPFRQRGRGSWYGKKFHGQKTSSGEPYDMYKMTAAHPTLPIPSYARVTNLANGKQVIVRVNDRGPFHSSRIVDLSYTAALKLGYIAHGSSDLEVERLLPDEIARMAMAGNRQSSAPQSQAAISLGSVPSPVVETVPVKFTTPAIAVETTGATVAAAGSAEAVAPVAAAGGFYLQLGAYAQAVNAESVRTRFAQNWADRLPPFEVVQNGNFYRIFSGPFSSRMEADAAALKMQGSGTPRPLVVQR